MYLVIVVLTTCVIVPQQLIHYQVDSFSNVIDEEEDFDDLDAMEVDEKVPYAGNYAAKYVSANTWDIPVDDDMREKRSGAKDYASQYASFVPRPGWTIADQYVQLSNK
jgi:hypothetical protein